MKPNAKTLLLPVMLIALGVGWLLSALGVGPGIDWVWTLGLAAVGVLTLAIGGVNKLTVVFGPFFMVASGLSILRQAGRMSFDVEVPILVIVMGVLLLIARSAGVPVPSWITESTEASADSERLDGAG